MSTVIRVERGNPDDVELAALVVVLLGRGATLAGIRPHQPARRHRLVPGWRARSVPVSPAPRSWQSASW